MICSIDQIDEERFFFDEEAAERPVQFFEEVLCHTSGEKAGQPFTLEEWQKLHLRNIFGWKVKGTNDRKHRFFYLEVPKGNGKSALQSGLVLFMAVEGPKGSETYCVAGDKFQARIVFDECRTMIEENPIIASKFQVFKNSIVHIKSRSVIHVISADAPGKHGFRPYFIAFDELHVQPNRDLYDVLTKGMMKTRDSMTGMITTAGEVGTFAEEIHDTAVDIAKGVVVNDFWYVAIYSAYNEKGEPPEDEDLFSEETIAQANPGYGSIIRPEDFKVIVEDTRSQKTGFNAYKQLHLNIWVGSLLSYINVHDWRKCGGNEVDLEYHTRNQTPAFCGLDLASVEDLGAFTMLFHLGEERFDWVTWCWCPEYAFKDPKNKQLRASYDLWRKEGRLIVTPGRIQDKDRVKQFLISADERFNIKGIGTDVNFHHAVLGSWLEEYPLPLLPFSQTLGNYTAPTKFLKECVLGERINYGQSSLLDWAMDNTMVYEDGNGQVRPMKTVGRGRGKGRLKKKIDPIVAGIMGFGQYLDQREDEDPYANMDWDAHMAVLDKRRK